jgi:hypothetical protein
MRCLAVAVVLLSSRLAAADKRTLFSTPLVLGFDEQQHAFVYGIRPEVILGLTCCEDRALGFGLYADVERVSGDTLIGAGLTVMIYRDLFAFGPSLGLYRRGDEDGGAVSLFVGLRFPQFDHVDLPVGIRVEGRFGGDSTTTDRSSYVISAQLDVLTAIGVAVYALDSSMEH